MKHLPYGGSTAARTIACPAWHSRAEGIPKTKAGKAADEGNLLHDAMELRYLEDRPFEHMVGALEYEGIVLTEDHITDHLEPAFAMTEQVLDDLNIGELMVEPFVQHTPDLIGGSIDMIGLSEDRTHLLILDFKFGRGRVNPDSPQLPFYAVCARQDPKTKHLFESVERVTFCIVQPAINDTAQYVEKPIAYLDEFWAHYQYALDHPERASAGDHCKFCPAAPVCQTKKAQALSALSLAPKTAQEISDALKLADDVEEWVNSVRDQAMRLIESGSVLPDHKLVEGRSTRRWTDEAEETLYQEIGDAAFERKLLGLGKIEKLIGKDRLNELGVTSKPAGKPVLVPREAPGDELLNLIPQNLVKKVAQHKK